MGKFIMAISFISANYLYQYLQETPDYMVATEMAWFQAVAMLFIVFYPKVMSGIKSN